MAKNDYNLRTITEAAEFLGVNIPCVQYLLKKGEIKYVVYGRRVFIHTEDLVKYLVKKDYML